MPHLGIVLGHHDLQCGDAARESLGHGRRCGVQAADALRSSALGLTSKLVRART
jgi:hypothetical protein